MNLIITLLIIISILLLKRVISIKEKANTSWIVAIYWAIKI